MRATATTINLKCATTAQMRAAFSTLSGALQEVGLAKHTTAGQIDLAAVTLPTDLDTRYFRRIGFEVRKIEAAGKPTLYMRIDYCLNSPASTPASTAATFRFAFGTEVAADGTMLGDKFHRTYATCIHQVATDFPDVAFPFFVSTDGGNWLTLAIDPVNTMSSTYAMSNSCSYLGLTLERTRSLIDASYDSGGFWGYSLSASLSLTPSDFSQPNLNGAHSLINNVAHLWGGVANAYSVCPNTVFATQSLDPDSMTVFPVLIGIPDPKAPGAAAVGYWTVDILKGTEFDLPLYGETMRFLAFGDAVGAYDAGAGSSYIRWALRIN